MADTEPRVVSGQDFALLTARPETRILFICLFFLIIGVIQGFREGWPQGALTLIGGAVMAVLGMLLFGRALVRRERNWTAFGSALMGFAPFLFGCYLVLFRGLWNGRALVADFSLTRLVASFFFIYFGYRLVYWTWQLTEIGEALRSGRLVISDAVQPMQSRGLPNER